MFIPNITEASTQSELKILLEFIKFIDIGLIIDAVPNIIKILKILLPIILPKIIGRSVQDYA